MKHPELSSRLDAAHRRLRTADSIELELERLDQLLVADGRSESGVDTLVGILASARRLPDTLLVRVVVPGGDDCEAGVEAAFCDHCHSHAELAWREAMTIRRDGLRSLPQAVLLATTFGVVATGVGALAESLGSSLAAVLLYVVAGISMIAAWASAWLPIEQFLFDWRAPAHQAAAYDLLAHARVEIVPRRSPPASGPERLGRSPRELPARR